MSGGISEIYIAMFTITRCGGHISLNFLTFIRGNENLKQAQYICKVECKDGEGRLVSNIHVTILML